MMDGRDQAPMKTGRILSIDDERSVRRSFVMALEDTRYTVDEAESGERGLEKMRAQRYDLVFLDMRMPGMDGVDTLRGIRGLDPDVPVHFVTAFHQSYLDRLHEAQADGLGFEVIRKPLSLRQIAAVVQSILDDVEGSEPPAEAAEEMRLTLYVLGKGARLERLVGDLRRACEAHVRGGWRLDVVDILEEPEQATRAGVLVTPTLVKEGPGPVRRAMGDLGDGEAVLTRLGVKTT
jgi:CheY-like chemotaxis protein